jgi:hypothetical protein
MNAAVVEKEKGIGTKRSRSHIGTMTKARAIALLWCDFLNQASFEGRRAVKEYWTLEEVFAAGFAPEDVAMALQATVGCEPPLELIEMERTIGETASALAQAGFQAVWATHQETRYPGMDLPCSYWAQKNRALPISSIE